MTGEKDEQQSIQTEGVDEEQDLIDQIKQTMATPIEPGDGGLKMVKGLERLEGHMRILVLTQQGSHTMNPGHGWPMKELIPTGDLEQIGRAIKELLNREENRIDPVNLEVVAAPLAGGIMPVTITYTLKDGKKRRNMMVEVQWPPPPSN